MMDDRRSQLVTSCIVRPQPDDVNCVFRFIDLIHELMLDVDATGISTGQISDQLFEWRRSLKWILRHDVQKALRVGPEIRRRDLFRVLLGLPRKNDGPAHQPGAAEVFLFVSSIPFPFFSLIPAF